MEFGIDPRNSFPFQHGRVARQIPKNLIAQQTNKQTNKQTKKEKDCNDDPNLFSRYGYWRDW
jgi:hypothetical protein